MTLVPITLPPGVYRNGTEDQSSGRWYDSDKMRWTAGTVRPEGGWAAFSSHAVTGNGRAILTWVDNSGLKHIAVGTDQGLFIYDRLGALFDITPVGFVAGLARATTGGGYGAGVYGSGDYGEPGVDPGLINEVTMWSLDTFGELLVATNNTDGKIYVWSLDTASPAVEASGAPGQNRALIVTDERFLFALGAAGNPRLVQWGDQQAYDDWTVDPTKQAGNFPLQTTGKLMCARRVRGGTLLFTDVDAWLATYQGAPLIYSFERIGRGCGIISQGAAVVGGDSVVAWMGAQGFWTFDGYAEPLPCDVSDAVFSDISPTQLSLITAFYNPSFGEITWLYPSYGAVECDRYVRWNHRENHWAIGALDRLCGAEAGAFPFPLMMGADGYPYKHEFGFDYGGATPYAESSPIEINNGDRVFTAYSLIPDELTVGSVQASFVTRMQPTGPITSYGPYAAASKTDLRFTARQARMRLEASAAADFRVGTFKLDITLGGRR